MRVAVIAGSLSAGVRIAREIERVPSVEVFVVACNVGKRSPALRWSREIFLALKSSELPVLTTRLWRYSRQGQLLVFDRPLDDPVSTQRLRSLRCDVGLHAANVIYRKPTIAAFRLGILNAHIGILPAYRGRSVAEWSVLQGDPVGVTVFFIDTGIDTGERIVLREFISPNGARSVRRLKKLLFDRDARLYRQALEALSSPDFRFERNEVSEGRRYYVMSKALTEAANEILREHGKN